MLYPLNYGGLVPKDRAGDGSRGRFGGPQPVQGGTVVAAGSTTGTVVVVVVAATV